MTFKRTRILFIIAIGFITLLHVFFGIDLIWLVLPIVAFLSFIIYGTANMQANFFANALCSANITEKHIALSFDDGPNSTYTPKVLALLAQYETPATFFIIGRHIAGNETILQQIDASGHSIGNHSYTHSFFIDFNTTRGFQQELQQTEEQIFQIIGKRMRLFRPPYGVITPHLAKAVSTLNYRFIGWTIRSFDTTAHSSRVIAQRVQSQIKPGAIILFHDTSDKTVQALKQLLDFTKYNDYKVVSIEQLLKIKAYE